MNIFTVVLEQPMFNLLIGIYDAIPHADLGLAIIALTVLIKAVLWPLTGASLKGQRAMQQLQPKLDAIRAEFKNDKEGQAKAMMELYTKEKVNPLSSCLPLLIQLPILIALYRVLRDGLSGQSLSLLYGFVQNPGTVNAMFLGLVDLAKPSIPLALIAAALQFWQTKMLLVKYPPKNLAQKEGAKDEEMMAAMNQSMTYMMPVMTAVIGWTLPGGLTLYWVAINAISILQQSLVFKKNPVVPAPVQK